MEYMNMDAKGPTWKMMTKFGDIKKEIRILEFLVLRKDSDFNAQ